MLAGVAVVFVVGVEFDVSAHGEQAACIERRSAPLVVLALAKGFGGDIRDEVIGADRKSACDGQSAPIAPGENAIFPVQIEPVPVIYKKPCTVPIAPIFR